MLQEETTNNEIIFPVKVIQEQLQKIYNFHPFVVSVVLRNFLSYIVNETISGRSNDIKEYNVAVDVLGKPAGFRTIHSGIVRVHAGRLRRALNSYYRELGFRDACIISVPTGRYVPVFKRPENVVGKFFPDLKSVSTLAPKEKIKMGVMPFHCFEQDSQRMAFADSIGLMLNESLGPSPGISLVSYFTTQQAKKKCESIKSLVSAHDLSYVLTGNVHFEGSKIRVNFQLILALAETQLYSETYCLNSSENYFHLSDMIVSRILTSLGEFSGWPGHPLVKNSQKNKFERTIKKGKFSFETEKGARTAIAG